MTDTPTTADVRNFFAYGSGPQHTWADSRYDFDRWLSLHDAQIRAASLREAANDLPQHLPGRDLVNRWLWDRAHRIENSQS